MFNNVPSLLPCLNIFITPEGQGQFVPVKLALPISLPFQILATTNLSVPMDLPVLGISYKWDHKHVAFVSGLTWHVFSEIIRGCEQVMALLSFL